MNPCTGDHYLPRPVNFFYVYVFAQNDVLFKKLLTRKGNIFYVENN